MACLPPLGPEGRVGPSMVGVGGWGDWVGKNMGRGPTGREGGEGINAPLSGPLGARRAGRAACSCVEGRVRKREKGGASQPRPWEEVCPEDTGNPSLVGWGTAWDPQLLQGGSLLEQNA